MSPATTKLTLWRLSVFISSDIYAVLFCWIDVIYSLCMLSWHRVNKPSVRAIFYHEIQISWSYLIFWSISLAFHLSWHSREDIKVYKLFVRLICTMSWYDIDCASVPFLLMMTSSNGNIFRVASHLCGEFTDQRRIPRTKASDAELWCVFLFAPE